jgi:hypothetical protein
MANAPPLMMKLAMSAPHLGSSLRSPRPQAGEEANESLREFQVNDHENGLRCPQYAIRQNISLVRRRPIATHGYSLRTKHVRHEQLRHS